MDQTTAHARAAATVRFEDGLGRRHHVVGVSPEPLEVLVLKEEIAGAPGVEEALRAQVARLVGFRHPSFAQVRGVARPPNNESGLAVISQRVAGVRLSDLLAVAEKRLLPLDMATACWLTRELLDAIVALHDALPGLCHGAISPERIVITPDTRLVLVEHGLGAALPKLRRSRVQYWREFRIALPPGDGFSSFGPRSDVVQAATVGLALMLGHPLGDDYPVRVGGNAEDTATLSAAEAIALLPEGIGSWMIRALQLGSEPAFASASDAQAEFGRALKGTEYAHESRASDTFVAAYNRVVPNQGETLDNPAPTVAARQIAAAPALDPSTPKPAARIAVNPPALATAAPESPDDVGAMATSTPTPVPSVPEEEFDPTPEWTHGAHEEIHVGRSRLPQRRHMIAAAAVLLLVVASATVLALRSHLRGEPPAEPAIGSLAVTTDPSGLSVDVDGKPRGVSPLHLGLPSGNHMLVIKSDADQKSIPVTITAGTEVSQFVEMPKQATVATGQLQIRTEPSGARVTVDGQRRGTSPLSVSGLTPGPHTVTVESEAGMVTEDVTVQPGSTSSLILPLSATRSKAPTSGWIAVAAPVEVQLYENKQLLGTSSIDKIMAAVGKHDLEIVNEALGFRETRSVTVAPGQVATISVTWPEGSMALNALPWAEVWVDGERVGETPVGNLPVPIGPHEVVFRHPDLGEQKFTTIVTLGAPARVTADMRKK